MYVHRVDCRFRSSVWLNKKLKGFEKSIEELDVKDYYLNNKL